MRRLYYGGSFNPIHHGHLVCARAVAEQCGYEKIVLVPNRKNPLKSGDTSDSRAGDRLEMCRLAVQDEGLFDVDPIELDRPGVSYTIDTVERLESRDGRPVHWLLGMDAALGLPSWRRAVELMTKVHFVVIGRPGHPADFAALPAPFRVLQERVVAAPLIEMSSTDIRRRQAAGRSIAFLTPPAVERFIVEHGLYLSQPRDRQRHGGEAE